MDSTRRGDRKAKGSNRLTSDPSVPCSAAICERLFDDPSVTWAQVAVGPNNQIDQRLVWSWCRTCSICQDHPVFNAPAPDGHWLINYDGFLIFPVRWFIHKPGKKCDLIKLGTNPARTNGDLPEQQLSGRSVSPGVIFSAMPRISPARPRRVAGSVHPQEDRQTSHRAGCGLFRTSSSWFSTHCLNLARTNAPSSISIIRIAALVDYPLRDIVAVSDVTLSCMGRREPVACLVEQDSGQQMDIGHVPRVPSFGRMFF